MGRAQGLQTEGRIAQYHGTTDLYLANIEARGLVPGARLPHGSPIWRAMPKVHLTFRLEEAEAYALLRAERCGGNPIVITIDLPQERREVAHINRNNIVGWMPPRPGAKRELDW